MATAYIIWLKWHAEGHTQQGSICSLLQIKRQNNMVKFNMKTTLCLASYVGCKSDLLALLLSAVLQPVLWRCCCWAPAIVDRHLPRAGPTAANPPHSSAAAQDGTNRQTDGQSDERTDGHRIVT